MKTTNYITRFADYVPDSDSTASEVEDTQETVPFFPDDSSIPGIDGDYDALRAAEEDEAWCNLRDALNHRDALNPERKVIIFAQNEIPF